MRKIEMPKKKKISKIWKLHRKFKKDICIKVLSQNMTPYESLNFKKTDNNISPAVARWIN